MDQSLPKLEKDDQKLVEEKKSTKNDKIVFFLHVVRCHSLTDAAKQYGISPSAGSRWITELEECMGVSLVKRTTRKITPTQAGDLLFRQFSHINTQITDVVNEIQNDVMEDDMEKRMLSLEMENAEMRDRLTELGDMVKERGL